MRSIANGCGYQRIASSLLFILLSIASLAKGQEVLPGTQPLTMEGDLASVMIDGIDRFLLDKIEQARRDRFDTWPRPNETQNDFLKATERLRSQLKIRIGMVDPVEERGEIRVVHSLSNPSSSANQELLVQDCSWPVFPGVDATGLLAMPNTKKVRFVMVYLPDAGQSPEDLLQQSSQTIPMLVRQGGVVLIPDGISRHREARNGRAKLTDQEYLYRSAFELGRHILGYQVQEAIRGLSLLKRNYPELPTVVAGWGEGGWIALHWAAVDPQVALACIGGHFGPREQIWKEPIHRNVHGQLLQYGDAELAALVGGRKLVIDSIVGPQVDIPGDGGAPGQLTGPKVEESRSEFVRAQQLLEPWKLQDSLEWIEPASSQPTSEISSKAVDRLLKHMKVQGDAGSPPTHPLHFEGLESKESRRLKTLQKWDRWNQVLLEQCNVERAQYWSKLDTRDRTSLDQSLEVYRNDFRDDVIGSWGAPTLPFSARTRKVYDTDQWIGYEVVLDVYADVFALGVLLVPKDLLKSQDPLQKRPCVVFQHGLEGRPKDTIEGDHAAYHNVSARLAEKGYVVFAPQNAYLFQDRFRTLQRKSNPLGRTLFSTIIGQHQQIVKWLATLPFVDGERIGFYGLSYGGKSAMRIPALVPEYKLSICSADFNDWVWKNASTKSNYSYVWTGEYEIFEFGLGPRFNYAEMAMLIAPRPFMVERGHKDGVAPDDRVASEFAKVRAHYTVRLKQPELAELEWFDGPHTIHGKGTFDFLDKHLKMKR